MAREKEPVKTPKGGPSVIRPLEVAEVPTSTRVMTVYVPAFVISGGVHLILVVVMLFTNLFKDAELEAKPADAITAAEVNEAEEKPEAELTNEDLGLDPELEASVEVEREEEKLVENVVTDEAIGIADATLMDANQTQAIGPALNLDAASGFTGLESPDGVAAMGAGGGMGNFSTPGMMGRSGATRDKLLKAGGGNSESEAAVAKGLTWLARKQIKDGSNKGYWEYDTADGKEHNYKIAATGMALLPFLAAGETHKSGKKYREVVARGVEWLSSQVSLDGSMVKKVGISTPYSHAIGTVALCEAVGMTKDPSLKQIATRAVNFIINTQAGDGSWGYGMSRASEGDTSIVGWMVQALKSADIAEIRFDKAKAYKAITGFLNKVQEDSGAAYGYRTLGILPR
ncbi:MAG: prenyltransferase/squalene oxidase repeat-containing protein [Zavarzinella sp.]